MRPKTILVLVILAGARAAESAPAAGDVIEKAVRGVFPHASRRGSVWHLERGDLEPRYRDLPHGPREVLDVELARSAKWSLGGQPATLVALGLSQFADCTKIGPSFVLIVLKDGQVVAHGRELFPVGDLADVKATERLRFDTALYQISETERAFGVRTKHGHSHRFACFADQKLDLFRVVGDDVVRILHTDVAYQQAPEPGNEDRDYYDPECEADPKSGTFRMLPAKTNGFFDIERNEKAFGRTVFRWNGSGYEPAAKEPGDRSVRASWGWDSCLGLGTKESKSASDGPTP